MDKIKAQKLLESVSVYDNISEASRELGIERSTLSRHLKNARSLLGLNQATALPKSEFEALVEGVKSELALGLTDFEQAERFRNLVDVSGGMTQSKVSSLLGIADSQLSMCLRMLRLPPKVLTILKSKADAINRYQAFRLRSLLRRLYNSGGYTLEELDTASAYGVLQVIKGYSSKDLVEHVKDALSSEGVKEEVDVVLEELKASTSTKKEVPATKKALEGARVPVARKRVKRGAAAQKQLAEALINGDEAELERIKLEEDNKKANSQIRELTKKILCDNKVREKIMGIAHHKPKTPDWLEYGDTLTSSDPGVPILFASDWHWGEVVNPNEIGGVNEYNLDIARQRAQNMIERAINLLTNHMVNPNYPGIIFALGGDMVSGNIHDELCDTNDMPIMPVVLDIIDHLAMAIRRLKAEFGRVFLPCVAGNHGRIHRKPRAKQSNFNSYDWLIYQFLDREFADDPDVVFFIPEGPDALISVYGHRYLFTHGNQFRGGDGMIGPLGPIIRGDHRKRGRNAQVGQEYDTLVIGHFHQLIQMQRVIVNGSLKGYDEYAFSSNFGYEKAQQALWLSHPHHGITFSMPVQVENSVEESDLRAAEEKSPWVSFHDAKSA